jgi:diacylglycerol kinase (ATP)
LPRKFLYIINPIAGTSDTTSLQPLLEASSRKAGLVAEWVHSSPTGHYASIEKKINDEGFTDIIIAGGDGTVSQVIGALRHLPIQFGIIPLGSGNGLARTAKIPMDPQAALQLIMEETGKATDGFSVNAQFACLLSGVGFDATVAHAFAQQHTRGLLTYVKEGFKHFWKASSYTFEIILDKKQFTTNAWMICIANANQFGNNVTIAPFAKLNDGLLDVIIVPKQSKLSLLWQLSRQLLGFEKLHPWEESIDSKKIIYGQTPTLTIHNKNNALLHIDGDPAIGVNTLSIEIIPQAFRLIRKSN